MDVEEGLGRNEGVDSSKIGWLYSKLSQNCSQLDLKCRQSEEPHIYLCPWPIKINYSAKFSSTFHFSLKIPINKITESLKIPWNHKIKKSSNKRTREKTKRKNVHSTEKHFPAEFSNAPHFVCVKVKIENIRGRMRQMDSLRWKQKFRSLFGFFLSQHAFSIACSYHFCWERPIFMLWKTMWNIKERKSLERKFVDFSFIHSFPQFFMFIGSKHNNKIWKILLFFNDLKIYIRKTTRKNCKTKISVHVV